ncbi:hypothetical protein LCGC14_3123820, partial [marine sediment metagenome]
QQCNTINRQEFIFNLIVDPALCIGDDAELERIRLALRG